ncbi:Methionyl-tRNA formyltransferase [Peribacillus frigoritolerans]|nr:Methionyl-tRNA formyltransferase [Peribacillus frigoritolerans]
MKIWQVKKLEAGKQALPGTIVEVQNDGFIVSTGNETAILVTELQPSGKKKMPAKDYLRGAGSFIKAGMKLGEQNEAN